MATAVLTPEKLPFYDLEKLYNFYQNAYGYLKPAGQNGMAPSQESVIPTHKLNYIKAINAAYQAHPQRFKQATLF